MSVTDTKYDFNSCLENIVEVFKSYWLHLTTLTKQSLVLDYYHKKEGYLLPWFEHMKRSSLLHFLNTDLKKASFCGVRKEKSSLQEIEQALACTSLTVSFNNIFIEAIQDKIKGNPLTVEIVDCCKSVSNAIYRFQSIIQSKPSIYQGAIDGASERMKIATDRFCAVFENENYDTFQICEQLIVYDIDILCAILGLQFDFAASLRKIRRDMWLHQSQFYHVINRLKNNSQKYSQTGIYEEEIFQMGFTEEIAAFIVNKIPNEFSKHQTSLYWATTYIENMFQNNPLLSQCNDYRFNGEENVFLSQEIRLKRPQQGQSSASIQYINVSDIDNKKIQTDISRCIRKNTEVGHSLYFHGTSHEDAEKILTQNINLKRGNPAQDFSDADGFYLSYRFSHAKHWARGKSDKPAILVFSIPDQLFDGSTHKGLDVSISRSDTLDIVAGKVEKWKEIVRYCRNSSQGEEPIDFDTYAYIIGPMSENGSFVGEEPAPKEINQLCIKKQIFAEEFGQTKNILCVIFYKTN